MLNVSRTPVSESWLASSIPLKSHKTSRSLDTQAGATKVEHNRFSMSTINSDLFPELLSWSAMMSKQPISPSQNIPSDISKRDSAVEVAEPALEVTFCLSVVFDPTSLDFGFDMSCLEGLDDLLIYSPLEAYEESCWSEATYSHSDRSPCESLTAPTAFPYPPVPRSEQHKSRRQTRSPLVTSDSSDESDTDSDSCMTYKEEDMHAAIVSGILVKLGRQQYATLGPFNDEKRQLYYDDDATSFILFDPSYPIPKPQESVGFFPIPSRSQTHRPSMPSRLVTFCAKLPSTLTSVRSPHAS